MGPDQPSVDNPKPSPIEIRKTNLDAILAFTKDNPQLDQEGRLNYLLGGSTALALITSAEQVKEADIYRGKKGPIYGLVVSGGDLRDRIRVREVKVVPQRTAASFRGMPFARAIGDLDVIPVSPDFQTEERYKDRLVDQLDLSKPDLETRPIQFGFFQLTINNPNTGEPVELVTLSPETLLACKVFQLMVNYREAASKEKFYPETEAIVGWARKVLGDEYTTDIAEAVMDPENMSVDFAIPTQVGNFDQSETSWFIEKGMEKYPLYQYLRDQGTETPDIEKYLPFLACLGSSEAIPVDPRMILSSSLAKNPGYLEKVAIGTRVLIGTKVEPLDLEERLNNYLEFGEFLGELPGLNYASVYLIGSPHFEVFSSRIKEEVLKGRLDQETAIFLTERLFGAISSGVTRLPQQIITDRKIMIRLSEMISEGLDKGIPVYPTSTEREGLLDFIGKSFLASMGSSI